MQYKKFAIIAAVSLMLTGCGKDDPADDVSKSSDVVVTAAEEVTEASSVPEETAEAVTTEALTTEEVTTEQLTTQPITEAETAASDSKSNVMTDNSGDENGGSSLCYLDALELGMTKEEVFSILGDDYDNMVEKSTRPSVEYEYKTKTDTDFGTDLPGYIFAEFDTENKLICFGCHLGLTGDLNEPVYPYTEDELERAYNRLLQEIELRFGAPSSSENQYSDSGVKAQNIWDTDKGQVWAIYGTNLWAAYAPDKYEKGVNEVVVSYSINY